MKIGNVLKSNWIYVLWFVLYFALAVLVFSFVWYGFLIVTIIYAVSIGIALSGAGEKLLRALNGVRHISTQEEKESILPLFQEVYRRAKETTPELSDNIQVFMTDDMCVNAYAFGKSTVVVTKGLIDTLEEEQVMGMLAHEFGHIVNGHTVMLLLNLVGNGIFSIFLLITRMFMFFIQGFVSFMDDNGGWGQVMAFLIRISFEWSLMFYTYIATAILMINSRKNEFQADNYALEIGFGEGLLQGLYVFQKMNMGQSKRLLERLTSSHPNLAYRIERLENNAKRLTGSK